MMVRWPRHHCSTRRAGMPAGLSSADTQMLVSNSATGGTSLGSHLSPSCGDVGFDRVRAVSAGPFLNPRQQRIELLPPLGFRVHRNETDLLLL